ncbi:hypothetical protein [Streptomyces sp. 1222.5]|uniref:hypothetical protein n=1 Tax=Streptomyces sp. 1222.5 TaxID=1881026 RepID=UPI003EBF531C
MIAPPRLHQIGPLSTGTADGHACRARPSASCSASSCLAAALAHTATGRTVVRQLTGYDG